MKAYDATMAVARATALRVEEPDDRLLANRARTP